MSELHRFERVQRRTNDLDVSLRHLLLRQPGGFEGFDLSPIDTPPDGLSVPGRGWPATSFVAPLRRPFDW